MTIAAGLHEYSFRDYLAVEELSAVKHEFLDGEIYAMAGGSVLHAALSAAVLAALAARLPKGCRAYSSDLRIRVLATGLASYADVTVVCGTPELDPEDADTVTNPKLVVEVLSKNTMSYDLGKKFEHYAQFSSVGHVVYLWQDRVQVEVRSRRADGTWSTQQHGRGARIELLDPTLALDVDAVYAAAGA